MNHHHALRPSCPLVTRGTPGGLGLTPALGDEQRQGELSRTGATRGSRPRGSRSRVDCHPKWRNTSQMWRTPTTPRPCAAGVHPYDPADGGVGRNAHDPLSWTTRMVRERTRRCRGRQENDDRSRRRTRPKRCDWRTHPPRGREGPGSDGDRAAELDHGRGDRRRQGAVVCGRQRSARRSWAITRATRHGLARSCRSTTISSGSPPPGAGARTSATSYG